MTVGGVPRDSRSRMRAASTDRDHVVELLKTAYADGRLDSDEYDTRLTHALAAKTYGELDRTMADLPGQRVAVRSVNQAAIVSLACGFAQVLLGPLPTVPAIVAGHMARKQIRQTGENGAGLALAGLLLGYAGALLIALFVAGLLFLVAVWPPS